MIFPRALTLVNAKVVGEEGEIAESLRVARGRVMELGNPPHRGDLIIDLGGDYVFPGLVNAHDHLAHNCFPRLKWRSVHANVREWIEDFQPRFSTDKALSVGLSLAMETRLLQGLVKNLLSGVTTVCHHDPPHPMLQRWQAGSVLRRFGWTHSLGVEGLEKVAASFRATPRRFPWSIHTAEGRDAEAAGEYGQLEAIGCVAGNTVLVHGIGLAPDERRRMVERGASLVWCPSSNHFLFGVTAEVGETARAGRLALGTDSRLSGERDILDELKAARASGQVDDRVLCSLVTSASARILRLDRRAVLGKGEPADLVVVPDTTGNAHAALVAAKRASLRLVLRNGRALLADPELRVIFTESRIPSSRVYVDGVAKCLDTRIVRLLRRFSVVEPGLELY